MHEITLTHFTDTGHRIVGHEGGKGKCARLHGHTYRWEITVQSPSLLPIGFVIDFGTIKKALDTWDHMTVLWTEDPILQDVFGFMDGKGAKDHGIIKFHSNPTAENMAKHFAEILHHDLVCAHGFLEGFEWDYRHEKAAGEGFAVQVEVWETPKSCARFVAR